MKLQNEDLFVINKFFNSGGITQYAYNVPVTLAQENSSFIHWKEFIKQAYMQKFRNVHAVFYDNAGIIHYECISDAGATAIRGYDRVLEAFDDDVSWVITERTKNQHIFIIDVMSDIYMDDVSPFVEGLLSKIKEAEDSLRALWFVPKTMPMAYCNKMLCTSRWHMFKGNWYPFDKRVSDLSMKVLLSFMMTAESIPAIAYGNFIKFMNKLSNDTDFTISPIIKL